MPTNQSALNIRYVLHEGDIVHTPGDEAQWKHASSSMNALDGVVPYAVVVGNHDVGYPENTTYFDAYFGVNHFKKMPSFGAGYPEGSTLNSYHLVSVGDQGNKVYQMLANYQSTDTAHLRIIEIDTGKRTVSVKAYSPHLDHSFHDDTNEFILMDVDFIMHGRPKE